MSAFSTLLALINAQIKTNGQKAITGAKLNGVLVQMVNELGSGYQFIDIATPATDPGTPDENVWYIASQAGTYTNFGGIIVNENEVCALVWNGSWTKKVTGAATAAQVNQLGQEIIDGQFSANGIKREIVSLSGNAIEISVNVKQGNAIYIESQFEASGTYIYQFLLHYTDNTTSNTGLYTKTASIVPQKDVDKITIWARANEFPNVPFSCVLYTIGRIEEKVDTIINTDAIYNVDYHTPLSSGYYTLNTAIAAVPLGLRKTGFIITFKDSANSSIIASYKGETANSGDWDGILNWTYIVEQQGVYYVNYDTSVQTTRLSIPFRLRRVGLTIVYRLPNNLIIRERFINKGLGLYSNVSDIISIQDQYWGLEQNWVQERIENEINSPCSIIVPEEHVYETGTVLADLRDNIRPGDVVYFSLSNAANAPAIISIILNDGTTHSYYGFPTSGSSVKTIEGNFVIPLNFNRLVAYSIADKPQTIHYLYVRRMTNPLNKLVDDNAQSAKDAERKEDSYVANRFANPLFETLEHYNTEHPNDQIENLNVLYRGVLPEDDPMADYRVPVTCITNNGTILVGGVCFVDQGDYGESSINIAKKEVGDSDFTVTKFLPYSESDGAVTSCAFAVDRTGANGVEGRIYCLYGRSKHNGAWTTGQQSDYFTYIMYSDDNGVNWSTPDEISSLWKDKGIRVTLPTGTKGIQITNGTLVIPAECLIGAVGSSNSASILFIKKPEEDWECTSICKDSRIITMDECAVVERSANEVILYVRCQKYFNEGLQSTHQAYRYDFDNDKFIDLNCTFIANVACLLSLDKIQINSTPIYLMGYPDSNVNERKNTTLWASTDAMRWVRIYRFKTEGNLGYSSIDNYDGDLIVAYESRNNNTNTIAFQDITQLKDLISDSINQFGLTMLSVQDRLQLAFNKINGINP